MVMWAVDLGMAVPATLAEACRLRQSYGGSCDRGGSTIANLRVGAKRLWGVNTPPALSGFGSLWSALVPGAVAVVTGSMAAFPAGSHWRRWDPGFAGKHAVEVMRLDALERVWWDDPLAPDGAYHGEWMPRTVLADFVRAWPAAQHLVAVPTSGGGNEPAEPVVTFDVYPGCGTATVKGTGHAYIRVEDGVHVPVPDGFAKPILAKVKLIAPAYGDGFLVGDRAAILLAKDCTWTP